MHVCAFSHSVLASSHHLGPGLVLGGMKRLGPGAASGKGRFEKRKRSVAGLGREKRAAKR